MAGRTIARLVLFSLVVASGCQLLVDLDRDALDTATSSATGGADTGGASTVGGQGGGTAGSGGGCFAPADCPGSDTDCSTRTCTDGSCGVSLANSGASCDDDGGTVCDGAGKCVECIADAQCSGDDVCDTQQNVCVPIQCKNSKKDGDETDVDCGGSCAPCVNGKICLSYGDCESRYCDPGGGSGGSGGATGGSGGATGGSGGATGGTGGATGGTGGATGGTGGSGGGSTAGVCAPCNDDAVCQSSDYCDTASTNNCVTKKITGVQCAGPGQCQSAFCADGYCCNNACGQTCEACDLTGNEGSCMAHMQGTDPESECTPDVCSGSTSCQCSDTKKNGAETDVDCGGGVCGKCTTGKDCTAASDCISGVCGMDSKCAAPDCGDGVIQAGEQCDDGNKSNNDDCPDDANNGGSCQNATCGDGFVDGQGPQTEDCDGDGNGTGGETAACNSDCSVSACGDGMKNVSDNEQCDDGNQSNNDDCPDDPNNAGTCQNAGCGDGFHKTVGQNLEQCDDGNQSNADDCLNSCNSNACGDGYIDGQAPQTEACDGDGNGTPGETAACNSDCSASACGDGKKNVSDNEQCDDGNQSNNDDCPDDPNNAGTCQDAGCGDGFHKTVGQNLEQCDDGNQSNADDCLNSCNSNICGDGYVDGQAPQTEPCDGDGNGVGGETAACNSDCTASACGDGKKNVSDNEQCDDGNQVNTDDCPSDTNNGGTCQNATCSDDLFNSAGPTLTESELDCGGPCYACPGGLLLTELTVNPTTDEFIEIHNPTANEISLSHVYLADFTSYYEVAQGTAVTGSADFVMKFPAGSSIAAGAYVVVSLEPAASFQATFGAPPDFDVDANDALAPAMQGLIGSGAGLTNGDEMVVLFFWDGSADLVKDVDYVVWGNTSDAMNKTAVPAGSSTYLAETAEALQAVAVAPGLNDSLNRCVLNEGTETQSASNGFSGHDETSENLDARFFELSARTPGAAATTCPGDHIWSDAFGTTGQDELMAVASDSSGNVVIAGWFRDSIDFGGGALADAGLGDIFVAKFDTSGNYVWAVKAGGTAFDGAWAVALDGAGDVYVTGMFESSAIDFGGGALSNTGNADVFVAKLSGANGAHVWSKSASGGAYERGEGIAVSGSNVVVGGFFESGTFNLGAALSNAGQGDIFVTQLATADGAHKFSKSYAGTNHDQVWDVATDAAGDIYITGTFNSSALAFNATILSTAGDFDVFAAQLSGIDGTTKWAKSYGGTAFDQGLGIAVNGSGAVALTGHFASSSMTFGAAPDTLTNSGGEDAFVAVLQVSDGSHTWSINGNGAGADRGEAIAFDSSGSVYVGGHFAGASLNLGSTGDALNNSVGGTRLFVARFAGAGGHVWSRSAAAGSSSVNRAMGVSATGGIYAGGFFGSSTLNFGAAGDVLTVSGSYDVFLAELQP